VAKWMLDQVDEFQMLAQSDAVFEIERRFGGEWIYENANGNAAIDRRALTAFKRLHGGRVEWDNGDKSWYHV